MTVPVDSLFDDASVFPPGNAPLDQAVPAHRRHRRSWYAATVGPLVVPVSSVPTLLTLLDGSSDRPLGVSLTGRADDGLRDLLDQAINDPRLLLRAVEVVVAETAEASDVSFLLGLPDDVRAFVEPAPTTARSIAAVTTLAGRRASAKLRTGGTVASAFPSDQQLAEWITTCVELDLPFKCTAGLHHAIRHTAPGTGFEHHGFLNVLLGVRAALDGRASAEVGRVLSSRDAASLAEGVRDMSREEAGAVRRLFTSLGTCSIDEPIADLEALDLLHRAGAASSSR